MDETPVVRQGIDRALGHSNIEQAVTCHIERDGMACSQGHRSQLGADDTIVTHLGPEQRNIAAVCVDGALIENRTLTSAGKQVVARHEVSIGNIQCRRDQAAHTDLRALAKKHTIRIHQKHLPVGGQAPQNGRRVRPQHAVERYRIAVGLDKQDRLTSCDVEALPIDHRILRRLVDGGGLSARVDTGAACNDHTTGGCSKGIDAKTQRDTDAQGLQAQALAGPC